MQLLIMIAPLMSKDQNQDTNRLTYNDSRKIKSILETILDMRLLSLPSTGDGSFSDKMVSLASQEGVGHDDDDHDNVDKTTNKEDRQQ